MVKGVSYDNEHENEYENECEKEVLKGYNQWCGKNIDEMDNGYRKNIYDMIIRSCKQLGIEIKLSSKSFNPKDGWSMSKDWLGKYAYGFIKELEKYIKPIKNTD